MSRTLEGSEDRGRRAEDRAPTKGAMAAERASAGLGTSDDDEPLVLMAPSPGVNIWAKRESKGQSQKPARRR